ncbi:MAG TPA: transposase [Sedimentisphaerales bacterium]|jgi:REP element-mobilizing transposase RayT|nr:transposase [Sedimentisphaerales bacterium]HNU30190.1 transposase [Sedimentisphaerales bacterium]
MARPLRIEYPGAFYHVMNRGQRQEPIVLDRRDRERFVSDLGRLSGRFHVLIHGYCLMTNHYHLILETPEGNLSRAVQWLNVAYAAYYNRRHQCSGHVFQGRFKSVLVDATAYLEALSRYLHLNPVRAGLVSCAWDYEWSSCRCFVGHAPVPAWLEVDRILGGFSVRKKAAQRRYAAYLSEADVSNPLAEAAASSVLGNQVFLRWVKDTFLSARSADPEIPELKRIRHGPSVAAIVSAVAKAWQVDAKQIVTPGRKRNHARDVAIYLCREMSGLPCRELGRRFGGISGAAITLQHDRLAQRMAKDSALTEAVTQIRTELAKSSNS